MFLNGLGFVSAPLYLFEQFFEGKATKHLIGERIQPSHLNDDRLERTLDKFHRYGVKLVFATEPWKIYSLTFFTHLLRFAIRASPALVDKLDGRLDSSDNNHNILLVPADVIHPLAVRQLHLHKNNTLPDVKVRQKSYLSLFPSVSP